MSRKSKILTVCVASLGITVCVTSAILISRAASHSRLIGTPGHAQTQITPTRRNLVLQPEAARVNRRLGNKFKLSSGAESTFGGILTVGNNQQPVTITRRRNEGGELVELLFPSGRFTWSEADGVKATSGGPTQAERLLVERLVFDSADQFVFAQLRGASYFTVARNVRPDDAGENYSGPLWNLVRVSEPQRIDDSGLLSPWRLYYINTATELIDRVLSELNGRTVEASIQWSEQNREQIPSRIRWTTNGETIMEYEVTTFSETR